LSAKLSKEQENIRYLDDDKQRLLKEVANYQQQLNEYKSETLRVIIFFVFLLSFKFFFC
jgi:hypothetical protein